MMKSLLTIFFTCLITVAFAQAPAKTVIVKGIVIDSALNKPMGFVTIALQDAATKAALRSSLSKEDGSFELKAPQEKTYQLAFAFMGYKSKVITIDATGTEVNVGRVVLASSVNQLKEVAVTALKPLMKQEVDRITYDVQSDPEVKAISALDMMRKVPLLAVDGSDNIKLKGSGNYKILINGKESALMAKNPSDVLKSMPATNIQKIEVITTPPAKYDAEGLAGIINIITKKNGDQGYTGVVNSRMNTVFGLGVNLNLSAKQGKLGVTGYIGSGNQSGQRNLYDNSQQFFARQSILSQSGESSGHGHNVYYEAELSYELDSLNLLTGSVESYQGRFYNDGDQLSNQFNSNKVITNGYRLTNNSDGSFHGLDAAINYQLGFKRNKEQLLTVSYKYSYSPNSQFTDINIFNRVNYTAPSYHQDNTAGNREHTVQVDYVHPLKNVVIEAGAKGIFRNNYSDFNSDTLNTVSGKYLANISQTNSFNYQQGVYSAYNSYQLKLDQWAVKAGLRLEHTGVDAHFTSANQVAHQSYNNLIPSISVQRKFKSSSLNLGFTQRIQRPGIYQLNPFVDRSNPNFVNTGNPDLRPELNNTFELTYSNYKKNAVTVGLSYAFSNNSIQNVTSITQQTVNGKTDTITTTTFRNLGSNNTLGLNINTNYAITSKISLNINGEISHVWLKGAYNGQLYKNDGYAGNIFANISYKINKLYRFTISNGYFSGNVNLQGTSSYYIFSSYVLGRDFFKGKATVSAVANNPYSKLWSSHSSTTTADFYQTSLNQNTYRSFAVRLNYRFGKLNSQIKKNQRGISNDDTKGGGNKGNSN